MQEDPVQRPEPERIFAIPAPRCYALFRIHKGAPRARNLIDVKYSQSDPDRLPVRYTSSQLVVGTPAGTDTRRGRRSRNPSLTQDLVVPVCGPILDFADLGIESPGQVVTACGLLLHQVSEALVQAKMTPRRCAECSATQLLEPPAAANWRSITELRNRGHCKDLKWLPL